MGGEARDALERHSRSIRRPRTPATSTEIWAAHEASSIATATTCEREGGGGGGGVPRERCEREGGGRGGR